MVISYKKLWKLLIDKDMKKKDLIPVANISSSTLAKITKGQNLNTDVLLRICSALKCDISDIMEVVEDNQL
jgi:DNA-binding Xre family transcriptional regulator